MDKATNDNNNNKNQNDNQWQNMTSGKTKSPWLSDITQKLNFQRLDQDISVDVVIIGGGIAGMSTAYLLSKAGKKSHNRGWEYWKRRNRAYNCAYY